MTICMMDQSGTKKLRHILPSRWPISKSLKGGARYLGLAFVALLGLNVENYIRSIPSNPDLNYVAGGIAAAAIVGRIVLRHSRLRDSKLSLGYERGIYTSMAWTFTTIGFILLGFPAQLVSFLPLKAPLLQNVALVFGIGVELAAVGIPFSMADGARESEDLAVAEWTKRESTLDYDAIVRAEEFS